MKTMISLQPFILLSLGNIFSLRVLVSSLDSNVYGPYVADFSRTKLTQCKGPKSVNQTIPNIWLMKEQNGLALSGNITILTNTRLSEVLITVRNDTKEDSKKNTWTYKFKEPCKYDFLRKSFKQIHNNENCFMYKGTYRIHVEVTKYIRSFLGETFFYGSYHIRILGLSKNGNLYCIKFTISIVKKIQRLVASAAEMQAELAFGLRADLLVKDEQIYQLAEAKETADEAVETTDAKQIFAEIDEIIQLYYEDEDEETDSAVKSYSHPRSC